MYTKEKKHIFIILLLFFSLSFCEEKGKILADLKISWLHYKNNKIERLTGRPLADPDINDISKGSLNQELTFSETISYVMFRAVLINDRETFNKTWKWAHDNMLRKNIKKVYNWHQKTWESPPANKKDNLFAWRYTPNINNSGEGGIIYYYWTPETDKDLWRDGLDVAPDGDQLIAGSLLFAHNRWGSGQGIYDYKGRAKNIITDLWSKTVVKITPGIISNFTEKERESWFHYVSEIGELRQENFTDHLKVNVANTEFAGIGKIINNCSLTNFDHIELKIKGNGFFRIILEDQTREKVYSGTYSVNNIDNFEKVIIPLENFAEKIDIEHVNIVMIELSNGTYFFDEIAFQPRKYLSKPRYHLLSNDKGMSWINVSYYMPFLYKLFAVVDSNNDWTMLREDAYKDINFSLYAKLHNDKNEIFEGKGILPPNWFTINEIGEIVDLPWAEDEVIDDYMSGWDAFRTWYFLALDKLWGENNKLSYYLKEKPYTFFKSQMDQYGYLRAGYTISGEIRNINWVDQNSAGINGAYLAFFKAADDPVNASKILKHIESAYNKAGFWEDNPREYYKQNWTWLGLFLYSETDQDLYQNTYEKLKKES